MGRILVVVAACLLSSCSFSPRSISENLNRTGIMGGKEVQEGSETASSVVAILDMEYQGICTGTIIAENYILTAAHCVADSEPNQLRIVFGLNVDDIMGTREPDVLQMYTRKVSKFRHHPDYRPERHETQESDWADIAIIRFSGDLPPGYKPAPMLKNEEALQNGAMSLVAGYGVDNVEVNEVDPKEINDIEEAIEYGLLICDELREQCFTVDSTGDGILREAQAPIAEQTISEVVLDESKGQGTCSGDSGGPAFVSVDGQWQLFGVTSRGGLLCNDVGVYTNATYFLDWIEETMEKLKPVQHK